MPKQIVIPLVRCPDCGGFMQASSLIYTVTDGLNEISFRCPHCDRSLLLEVKQLGPLARLLAKASPAAISPN